MTVFRNRNPQQLVATTSLLMLLPLLLCGCRDKSASTDSGGVGAAAGEGTGPAVVTGSETEESKSGVQQPCAIHFRMRRSTSGIEFVHNSGDSAEKPFPAANGSGVGAIDFDHDGFVDLYFATGNTIATNAPRETSSNKVYRNIGGWKFLDCTSETGLGLIAFSAGISVGDFNGDGFPDLFVSCFGPNRLYENQGDGTFRDASEIAAVGDLRWGTSATFLDFNADGLLDLYSGNYGQWTLETNQFCGDRDRALRTFCSPNTVAPEFDSLYENNGNGTFTDVAPATGIANALGRTQGVLAADFNGDSLTDVYLGNDLNPNALFMNQQGQTYIDQAETLGTAYDRSGAAQAGMGVAAADVDRDGFLDLLVTNFENEHNAFYRRDADGFYQDASHTQGLAAAGMPYIGWGTMLADFDQDGWHDAIVINGHTDDNMHELGREGDYLQRPLLWQNISGRFQQIDHCAGEYFQNPHPARGLAIADLDNDVDWDVICCHQDSPPELLENDSQTSGSHVGMAQIQLVGTAANRDAIGTTITMENAGVKFVEQIIGGGSYLSSSQRVVLVPCDSTTEGPQSTMKVIWPGGRVTECVRPDSAGRYVLIEPASENATARLHQLPE